MVIFKTHFILSGNPSIKLGWQEKIWFKSDPTLVYPVLMDL